MTWWGARKFPIVMALLTAVPFVVVLIGVVSQGRWFPAGDMAQAELHMRGFFSHPPLVGAAGRIVSDGGVQGSHPGPSLWLVMLPVYWLGGSSSASLMAAVVSVHVASAAVALRLAWVRFGWPITASIAVVVLAVVRASGPDFVIEPWNPWLAILPFLVFVLLVDRCRFDPNSRWSLFGVIAVGSHCVQCHAGYAILVVIGVAIAGWPMVRSRGWTGVLGPLALLVAVWTPPLIDQWRRDPGNLSILWQHFVTPSEPRIPVGDGVRVFATQFNVLGPWLWGPGGEHPAESWFRWPGLILFAGLVIAAYRIARRDQRPEAGLLGVFGSMTLGAVFSISRLFGPYFEYTIRWAWILAGVMLAVSLVIIVREASNRTNRSFRAGSVVTAVCVAVALWSTGVSVDTARGAHRPGPTDSEIVGGLAPQLSSLDDGRTYLVRFWDPYTLNATGFGVVLEMERRGYIVRVEPRFAAAALPHRTSGEEDVDSVLWVVVGPRNDVAAGDGSLERVAYFDPREESERSRADDLLADIEGGLRRAGREELIPSLTSPGASLLFAEPPLPDDVAADLRSLYLLGQPVGVYITSPGVEVPSLG